MNRSRPSATRRHFIVGSSVALGGALMGLNLGQVLAAAEAAREMLDSESPLVNIDSELARTLSAVADQIWPQDDTLGASELGVLAFMDQAAGGFMAGAWPTIQAGATDLEQRALAAGSAFHALAFDQQTELLESVQSTPFFGTVHFLVLLGCFAMPRYGGNRNQQGWAQIGFEQRHAWQPPFGHYDGAVGGEGGHGDA